MTCKWFQLGCLSMAKSSYAHPLGKAMPWLHSLPLPAAQALMLWQPHPRHLQASLSGASSISHMLKICSQSCRQRTVFNLLQQESPGQLMPLHSVNSPERALNRMNITCVTLG